MSSLPSPLHADPRTSQAVVVMIASGVLLAVHLGSFYLSLKTLALVSPSYLWWACIALPILSIAFSLWQLWGRKWHWGQGLFFVLVALTLSFLQLLVIGEASASV